MCIRDSNTCNYYGACFGNLPCKKGVEIESCGGDEDGLRKPPPTPPKVGRKERNNKKF